MPSGQVLVIVDNCLYVDVKDVGERGVQFATAFAFGRVNRRCFFHVSCSFANDILRNVIFFSNVIQEMTESRMEQLNWRRDAYPWRSCLVSAIVDRVSYLRLCVRR
jgi:hypothetical protein